MLIALLAEAAIAQGCPQIPELVGLAWTAYEFAELDQAREALAEAGDALACQDRVVRRETLLELYLLTAQVALTLEDEPRMTTALERAVAVDPRPEVRPGAPYSPELVSLWDRLAARASTDLVEVRVTGAGTAYVDGLPATAGQPREVPRGLHLVQTLEPDGFRSEVLLVLSDQAIATPGMTEPPPRAPVTQPVRPVAPEPLADDVRRRTRTRRLVAGGAGVVLGATAVFTLASGAVSERAFHQSAYDGPVVPYYDVPRGDPRYPQARQEIIQFDGRTINLLYGVGYASAAASATLFTVALLPPKRVRATTAPDLPPPRR